jgi:hypothetical protein
MRKQAICFMCVVGLGCWALYDALLITAPHEKELINIHKK